MIYLWDDMKGLSSFPYQRYAYVKNSDGTYISLHGDRLKKVYRWPKDAMGLHESDVSPTTRVLVDMYTDSDVPSDGHTVLNFDIETSTDGGFPDWKTAENTITSIAGYDSVTKDYFVYALDVENKLDDIFTRGNVTIETFSDEESLLRRFLDKYEEIAPSIITGWNIDYFDVPYLYSRISRILGNYEANRLSPVGIVQYNERRKKFFIAGVSALDYLSLFRKFSYTEEPSYTLDAIGKKEVGLGKIEYEGDLDDLFDADIEKYIQYNVRDVEIVTKLDEKLQYIELVRGICHVGHIPYEDVYYSSRYLEGAILAFLKNRDIVAPNRAEDSEQQMRKLKESGVGFSGAFVKQPNPGRYSWVYDLDLTSLYPSIIMSLNISPETKVCKIGKWDSKAYMKGEDRLYEIGKEPISYEDLHEFIEEQNLSVSSNGVLYRQDQKGVIPAILELWFNKRVEYKDLMTKYGKEHDDVKYEFYKKRQLIQKILLNSLYGVLGLPSFRFYDIDNAEAVTTVGQTVIKFTANRVNAFYNKELGTDNKDYCIYIDTDSVFFQGAPIVQSRHPDIDVNDETVMAKAVFDVATEVQNYLNKSYDVLSWKLFNVRDHRFEIKREMVAKSGIWIAKKRYAQWIIYDNGVSVDRLDVKGIDVVRSSFPTAFKKIMTEVLHDILNNVGKEDIDQRILAFKRSLKTLDLRDIAKSTSVRNMKKWDLQNTSIFKNNSMVYNRNLNLGERKKSTPAHAKAAISYNELMHFYKVPTSYGLIRSGDKIKWVYLKNNPFGFGGLAFRNEGNPPEIMELLELYLDYNKLYERELERKFDDFYMALGWDKATENEAMASKFFEF